MIKRLNNKGNTLGIVLIGIFILSILGTLILGITSTNYNMKLNDKKSEMVFYYSEKAADLLYTEIGNEVMECVKNSYSDVLENAVVGTGSTYTYLTKAEATELFNKQFLDGKSNPSSGVLEFEGVRTLYPDDSTKLDDVLTRFEGYISSVASGYTFEVNELTGTNATKIEYVNKLDASGAVTADIDKIKISNVCIECKANSTGNYVNIVTDFLVKVPNIEIDFSDTKTSLSAENLYSYAIIAQGKGVGEISNTNPNSAVLRVDAGKEASIDGNVYVGADDSSNITSVLVEANAKLNCKAQVLYSEGRFVVREGSANLNSKTGLGEEFNENTLQFFANNISTEKAVTASVAGNSMLDVNGNIIVKDDLELNADNSTVTLKGNYFGYGFRGNVVTDATGTSYNEYNTGTTVFDISQVGTPATTYEHLQSSAIIVNANNSKLDLTGLKNLLVAGRAYIDLDESSGIDTSYMTGESISVKGNQIAYQADESILNGLKSGMSYTELQTMMGSDRSKYYTDLGLDPNKVIAKKVGSEVYFYTKPESTIKQTEYYENVIANNTDLRNNTVDKLTDMGLELLIPSVATSNIYTVGNYFGFNKTEYTMLPDTFMKVIDSTTEGQLGFCNLLKDIDNRKSYLIPTLNNVDSEGEKFLGKNLCDEPTTSSTGTPYQYYLSPDFIGQTVAYNANTDVTSDASIVNKLTAASIDTIGKNIGYVVDNTDNPTPLEISSTNIRYDMGVIITNRPVVVKKDFMGLIITEDKITVEENATITANYDLTKIIFTSTPEINAILNAGLGSMVDEDVPVVEVATGLSYEDLVEKSNWRKNVY
ncbi:MAG: hypothetical protein IJA34_08680 [Lachnospiraceae bacterium]|nr:hypothetical protein [Lachnospiraceae bacterium]